MRVWGWVLVRLVREAPVHEDVPNEAVGGLGEGAEHEEVVVEGGRVRLAQVARVHQREGRRVPARWPGVQLGVEVVRVVQEVVAQEVQGTADEEARRSRGGRQRT